VRRRDREVLLAVAVGFLLGSLSWQGWMLYQKHQQLQQLEYDYQQVLRKLQRQANQLRNLLR
jgi:predicted negative regulator of RcsB-dependent stress response